MVEMEEKSENDGCVKTAAECEEKIQPPKGNFF